MGAAWCAGAVAVLLLGGCGTPQMAGLTPGGLGPAGLAPLPETTGNATAAPRRNGSVGTTEELPPAQVSYGSPPGRTGVQGSLPATAGDISLDFADTDIREVVAQILGTLLHRNYTIDPAVHGTATFRSATPLSRAQLLPTLEMLLGQAGATLVPPGAASGGAFRVIPAQGAIGGSVVVRLRYASADALAKLLQPLAGNSAHVAAEPAGNALLIAGDANARTALIELAQSFDVDALAGQSYALLPVPSGTAKDFAQAMQDLFHGQGGALAGQVRVVPLDKIDAVLLAAAEPRYLDQARRVFTLVEREQRFTVRSWHVYYLQNSHADSAAYLLQEAFTPNNVTATPGGTNQAGTGYGGGMMGGMGQAQPGGAPGGAMGGGALGSGIAGGGVGGIAGGVPGGGLAGGMPGGAPGPGSPGPMPGGVPGPGGPGPMPGGGPGANPLLGGLEGGGVTADTMRIIPNPQNNAVLVYATPQEAATVEAMLRKVDILPLQVRIDAVIAEVTLNDALQYGTQFFFKQGDLNQTLSTGTSGAIAGGFPGFVLGSVAGNASAAISALQSVTTVDVLSSPELMVLDNQMAHLQVGSLVPYLTTSSQSVIASSAVINSVSYQPVGVIMDVTPRVNSGGLVTLDIVQEVSDVSTAPPPTGIASPTFDERRVVSRVVVQDGQTIGLAGLIQDSISRSNQGIPWLKDVPLLGLLAGTQNNQRQRTELLVLITPHVVHDQRDARALTEALRAALPNAAIVPEAAQTLPLSGSPDPGAALRHRLGLSPAP
jgi:general secretion pathway protein D